MLSINQVLNRLRMILTDKPSKDSWNKLCDLLNQTPRQGIIPVMRYANGHLNQWPNELKDMGGDWSSMVWSNTLFRGTPLPFLSLVRTISLDQINLTDREVQILANTSLLYNVQTIDISGNRITGEGIASLLTSSHLLRLRYVHMHGNILTVQSAERLDELSRQTGIELIGLNLVVNTPRSLIERLARIDPRRQQHHETTPRRIIIPGEPVDTVRHFSFGRWSEHQDSYRLPVQPPLLTEALRRQLDQDDN